MYEIHTHLSIQSNNLLATAHNTHDLYKNAILDVLLLYYNKNNSFSVKNIDN